MTRHTENMRVQRYEILSFLWMVWKLTLKLASLSIFRPNALGRLSDVFSEIYSRLWDFAEHSISHKDFYLPSSLGVSAVNRVNILLAELYGPPAWAAFLQTMKPLPVSGMKLWI